MPQKLGRGQIIAATVIVVAVAVFLGSTGGLPGRAGPEPQGTAMLTAAPWAAGKEAGEWTPVPAPRRMLGLLASPELLAERPTAAVSLPAGVLVRNGDLIAAADAVDTQLVHIEAAAEVGISVIPGQQILVWSPPQQCATTAATLLSDLSEQPATLAVPRSAVRSVTGTQGLSLRPADGPETDDLAAVLCADPPSDSVVVTLPVDFASWFGPRPIAGERIMLGRASETGRVCGVAVVTLWSGHPAPPQVIANTPEEAWQLSRPEDGTWTALPARSNTSAWLC